MVPANKIPCPEFRQTDTQRDGNGSTSFWRYPFFNQARRQPELSKMSFVCPVSLRESCSCGFK